MIALLRPLRSFVLIEHPLRTRGFLSSDLGPQCYCQWDIYIISLCAQLRQIQSKFLIAPSVELIRQVLQFGCDLGQRGVNVEEVSR